MPFLLPLAGGAVSGLVGGLFGGHKSSSGGGDFQKKLMELAGDEEKRKNALVDENQGTLDYFQGKGGPTTSPLYHDYVTQGTEATAQAYDRAVSNTRENAVSRGFGYQSPLEQGAESEVRATQAGAQARVPGEALTRTVEPMMNAARIRAGEASGYGAAPFMGDMTQLESERLKSKGGLFQSLLSLAGTLGGPLIDKFGGSSGDSSEAAGNAGGA